MCIRDSIVSGLIHRKFGYDNVGFHLGSDYCTMDFNGPIPKDALEEIEREANRAVFSNLDIQISYPSKEELKELDYRSKIEIDGQVRIVTVPGYDVCACCCLLYTSRESTYPLPFTWKSITSSSRMAERWKRLREIS